MDHNTKRRRLERDSSRSGHTSTAQDEYTTTSEALTPGSALAAVATPEASPENSLHQFNAARLDSSSVSQPPRSPWVPEPRPDTPESLNPAPATASVSAEELLQTSGAYCAREAGLQIEEDAGRLSFACHFNDGVEQHMIWLVGLKNIFSRQLPNMPKEYIVRLVLDRTHKSMMIVKNNAVVGGITYRPYATQRFGEIAFCAITAAEQVKGYGTRLMNHLKRYCRDEDKLTHFLTYADNNAVGYFAKQGFTKAITLAEDQWKGYIKDYDGGTLMECVINPRLPYTTLPAVVRRQRQAIDERMRELSNCHTVHLPLDLHKNELGIPRRPISSIGDIPGLREAGWTPDQSSNQKLRLVSVGPDAPPTKAALQAFMRSLHKSVSEHQDAWPFKEPVDPHEVADYYDVIKDPIDLRTMLKRLDSEVYYVHLEMFVADMKRMFRNAMKYNSPETIYFKAAKRLESVFMNRLKSGVLTRTS